MHACIHPSDGWTINLSLCSMWRAQKRNANMKAPLRSTECGLYCAVRTAN